MSLDASGIFATGRVSSHTQNPLLGILKRSTCGKRTVWHAVATHAEHYCYHESAWTGIASLLNPPRGRKTKIVVEVSYDQATSCPGSTVVPCQGVDEGPSAGFEVDRFNCLQHLATQRAYAQMAVVGGR